MTVPPLPLLLYGEPTWLPSPRKIHIYLQEKQLPESVVKVVPHVDPEASKAYPPIAGKSAGGPFGPTVPKLAILKSTASENSISQSDYTWLFESSAIIEYLEDLCDAHPELTSVPSLRHGPDLARRAIMRAQLIRAEGLWMILGATLVVGSQPYNDIYGTQNVHVPSGQALARMGHRVVLEKLDEQLGEIVDFEGLAKDIIGAATVADIVLFGTLHWFRHGHGIDAAKGFGNIERFMEAWEKRKSALAGLNGGNYPEMVIPFRTGMKEGIWPQAVFD